MVYLHICTLYEKCHIFRSWGMLQDILQYIVVFRWHPLYKQIRLCRCLKRYLLCTFTLYIYILIIYDFNYVCFRKLYTLPWSPHEHERVVPFLKQIGADFFVEVPVHADAVPHLQTLLVASQVGAPGFPTQVDCEPAVPSPQTIKIYPNQHIHTLKFIQI